MLRRCRGVCHRSARYRIGHDNDCDHGVCHRSASLGSVGNGTTRDHGACHRSACRYGAGIGYPQHRDSSRKGCSPAGVPD